MAKILSPLLLESRCSFDTKRRDKQGLASTEIVPIEYNGGRVLSGATLNVYIIYYGTWPAKAGPKIIENFISSLSLGSANKQGAAGDPKVSYWWATNTKYYSEAEDGTQAFVSTEVKVAKVIKHKGFVRKKVSARTAWEVVRSKIGTKKPFPYDANGIYLMIASKNVKIDGFCKGSPTPNGNPGIDSMIVNIANVIAASATNPDRQSGWFDADGYTSVNKCLALPDAFEPLLTAKNAKGKKFKYNVVGLNSMKFMVPNNLDPDTNSCVMQTISP
ncbi:unnamed protein product [Closterium sp. Yama58-4]|nr:unnamed protein product [Closterium sp. Yama58-4]